MNKATVLVQCHGKIRTIVMRMIGNRQLQVFNIPFVVTFPAYKGTKDTTDKGGGVVDTRMDVSGETFISIPAHVKNP